MPIINDLCVKDYAKVNKARKLQKDGFNLSNF